MLLTDMADVLRKAGCTVQEVAGWKNHYHGQMSSVECIVIHHTAGASTGDYPSLNVVRNGRAGLPGPLSQLGVGRSGKVYVVSSGVSWHAGSTRASWMDNYHAIGIEVESVGTGPVWPEAQIDATAKATAALCKRYGVPVSRVLGHKEICYPVGRKVDPVGIPGDMPAFRARVQKYINNPSGGGFLMALNDAEQNDVLYAARNLGRYIESVKAEVNEHKPFLVKEKGDDRPAVYVADGSYVTYRHVRTEAELNHLKARLGEVQEWNPGTLGVLGVLVGDNPSA